MARPRTLPLPCPNRRRKVTVIGLTFTGSEPFLAKCHSIMDGPPGPAANDAARATLMHSVAAQRQVPVEDIEIHDVLILSGHVAAEGEAEPADMAEAA